MLVKTYFANWMGMSSSLEGAKCTTPEAEHEDIRAYVEKSSFDLVNEQKHDLIESQEELVKENYECRKMIGDLGISIKKIKTNIGFGGRENMIAAMQTAQSALYLAGVESES